MVEVFKTNVADPDQSEILVQALYFYFPNCKINFDLEDCDKILRVEGIEVCPQQVIKLINGVGYQCIVLEDTTN